MKISKYLLVLVMMLVLVGCEEDEQGKLYAAQECLDRATDQASANECVAMVDGIESASAYVIRASGDFIGQGFTASKIAGAFINANTEQAAGNDPLVGLMSGVNAFVFDTLANAELTNAKCAKTMSEGMMMFGNLIVITTAFKELLAGAYGCAEANIDDVLANCNGKDSTIGTLVNTLDSTYCANPDNAGTDICTEVISAADASSPSAAGATFRSNLQEE
jgi:hypothetical protein